MKLKKSTLFAAMVSFYLVLQSVSVAYASSNWNVENGTPQLLNFNKTTLSQDLFLKHEISLDTIGSSDTMLVNDDTLYSIGSSQKKVYATSLDTKALLWEFTPPNGLDIRNMVRAGTYIAVLTPENLYLINDHGGSASIVWEKNQGGNLLSFDAEHIYMADRTSISAIKLESGEKVWSYTVPSNPYYYGQLFNSPIVPGIDKVYFVINDQTKATTNLFALNKQTGQVLWTTNVDYYAKYPLLLGTKIFLATQTEVYAYDANEGTYLWRKKLDSAINPINDNTFSSNENTIFVRTQQGYLYGLNAADGNILFQQEFCEKGIWSCSGYSKGPALVTNEEIAFENIGKIKFFNTQTGESTRILTESFTSYEPMLVTDKYFLVASNDKLYVYATPEDQQYKDPDGDQIQEPTPITPQGEEQIHVVQSGDVLWKIAQKYNVTVQQILDRNKLSTNDYLWVGQNIIIPKQQTIYTVQSGDTLWKISQQYKTTVKAIMEKNNLDPLGYLFVGQKLVIPDEPEEKVHIVQSGDTLWLISVKYNTTISAIIQKNNLDPKSYLWVGQKIVIP